MDIFSWPVQTKPSGTNNFRTVSTQFGDGYSQDAGDGINNKWQNWQVTIDLPNPDMVAVKDFLDRQQGFRKFVWTPPYGKAGYYICKSYTETPHLDNQNIITATFEQRF